MRIAVDHLTEYRYERPVGFGEHSLYNHGNSLYLPNVRVPILVALPGSVPANVNVDDVVCVLLWN